MSLDLPALSALDPAAVAAAQATLAQLLGEAYPGIDLTRGVVHDLLLRPQAALQVAQQATVDTLRNSQSLAAIEADPAGADLTAVANLLGNFGVAAGVGSAAAGSVALVVSALAPLVIPAGPAFAAGGVTFAPATPFAVRTDPSQVQSPTDLVLTPLAGGQYAATVPVACTAVGVAGMLRAGAAVTPAFTVPGLVQCYAAGDFTGGLEAPGPADLLAALQAGVPAKVFAGRANVQALVRAQPASATTTISVVGHGDPELLRAQRGLFPVAVPGRCDVYCRTAPLAAQVPLTKVATLVGLAPGGGTWQFGVAAADAPGFYRVARVALPGANPLDPGFAITSDVRSADLSAGGWLPDVLPGSALEAAYCPYQAAVIRFTDTQTPTAGLTVGVSTASYAVGVEALPGLGALQAFLAGRGVRPWGGDVLVRGAVPCDVSVAITVLVPPGAAAPDPAPVAAALANLVNGLGFAGALYASALAGAAATALPAGVVVGPVDMQGTIRAGDGSTLPLRDLRRTVLAVPDRPDVLVSARTVNFFLDPADVAVVVRTLGNVDG